MSLIVMTLQVSFNQISYLDGRDKQTLLVMTMP